MGCVSSFGLARSSSTSSVKSSIFITSTSCVGLIEPLLTELLLLALVLCMDLWALRLGSPRKPLLTDLAVAGSSSKPSYKSANKICGCLWEQNVVIGRLAKGKYLVIVHQPLWYIKRQSKIENLLASRILTVGSRRIGGDVMQFKRLRHIATWWYSTVHIQRVRTLKFM